MSRWGKPIRLARESRRGSIILHILPECAPPHPSPPSTIQPPGGVDPSWTRSSARSSLRTPVTSSPAAHSSAWQRGSPPRGTAWACRRCRGGQRAIKIRMGSLISRRMHWRREPMTNQVLNLGKKSPLTEWIVCIHQTLGICSDHACCYGAKSNIVTPPLSQIKHQPHASMAFL